MGTIPSELALLTSLKQLFLDHNDFGGSIPEEILTLPNLEQLDVNSNSLTGGFPLFTSPNLQSISVGSNRLTGTIPETIGMGMSKLVTIDAAVRGDYDDVCVMIFVQR